MNQMKCEECNETFVPESTDDFHSDDAGEYHAECYADYVQREGEYWGRVLGFIR